MLVPDWTNCISVRETGVFRHHEVAIEGPLKPIGTSQSEGFQSRTQIPNEAPIVPRDASLSDSRYNFSSSLLLVISIGFTCEYLVNQKGEITPLLLAKVVIK